MHETRILLVNYDEDVHFVWLCEADEQRHYNRTVTGQMSDLKCWLSKTSIIMLSIYRKEKAGTTRTWQIKIHSTNLGSALMFCLEAVGSQQDYDELVPLPIIFYYTAFKLKTLVYNAGWEGKKL